MHTSRTQITSNPPTTMLSLYDTCFDTCHNEGPPIFGVLDKCDAQTLKALSRTCKTLHQITQLYETRAWNITSFFSNWFISPDIFRATLRDCDGLVYGPAVVNFFDRVPPTPHLKIVIGPEGAEAMALWLCTVGYNVVTLKHSDAEVAAEMSDVGGPTIQDLVRCIVDQPNKPPLTSIMKFQPRVGEQRIYLVVTWDSPFMEILESNTSEYDEPNQNTPHSTPPRRRYELYHIRQSDVTISCCHVLAPCGTYVQAPLRCGWPNCEMGNSAEEPWIPCQTAALLQRLRPVPRHQHITPRTRQPMLDYKIQRQAPLPLPSSTN